MMDGIFHSTKVEGLEALALMTIGACFVAVWLSSRIMRMIKCIRFKLSGEKLKHMGDYAVVTGATDGIGKAYARELAQAGLNIVLIARDPEKLKNTQSAFKQEFPNMETKYIVADFDSYPEKDPELYERIKTQLAGLDVGILINNVGCSYPSALFFHELEDQDETLFDRMIRLNVTAATHMTRIVLPEMVAKRRGAIINISSAAGRIPIGNPLYAEYSASKAYVDFFSRSLYGELKQFGVHVQCQVPYFVTTKLSKLRKPSYFTPTPETWAKSAVSNIGYASVTVPYWPHRFQDWIIRLCPAWLLRTLLVSMHLGIRKKYLKKQENNKKTE